jgi:amidase
MSSTQLTDLAFTPALTQAKLIKEGVVSPLELTQLYIDRLEKYNPQLNCFYHIAADRALEDAKLKTEQLATVSDKNELPIFFGVPTAIKDLSSVTGMPTSYGVAALKTKIANYDDGMVTKIKQAGAIILGKTATSQLGSLPYTEPEGFAPTRNPWHLDYTPGGSSGGAAVAVAAGLCAIAQGGDAGGSIRGPAFCCGLVGIKPSRGRVSYAPLGDRQNGIGTYGVLARNVRDGAALLDVMSGYIAGDPYWLSDPEISFTDSIDLPTPPLNIAVVTSVLPFGDAEAQCQKPVAKVAEILGEMGHCLTWESLGIRELIEPFVEIWAAGVASAGIPEEALSPMNRWIKSKSVDAGSYLQAVTKMQLFSRKLVSWCDNYDVILTPTYMHPTIPVAAWSNVTPQETLQKIANWILPCPPFNATGQPAMNLPVAFDDNGVPLGVQLVGKPAAEATILRLAARLEAELSWHKNRPANFS